MIALLSAERPFSRSPDEKSPHVRGGSTVPGLAGTSRFPFLGKQRGRDRFPEGKEQPRKLHLLVGKTKIFQEAASF
jgi:hypothetical protein